MTVQQLSDRSVKVYISAEELRTVLSEGRAADKKRMLRLALFLMSQAEAVSRIPFSASSVAVELLTDTTGGLTAYFSAIQQKAPSEQVLHLSAVFPDIGTARECCRRLSEHPEQIGQSRAYLYRGQWILVLKLHRSTAAQPYHLLLEYGRPCAMTLLNRARLSEYGRCVCRRHAVETLASTG